MLRSTLFRRVGVVPAGLAMLAVAGCGGAEESSSEPSGDAETVTVSETEWALELSREDLAPGTYTFVAENDGDAPHALAIRGPGVDTQETEMIASGETAELTTTLEEGSYEVWCPVPGHRASGMELTVGADGDQDSPAGNGEDDNGGGY